MSRKVLIVLTLICLISVFSLVLVGQEIEKVKAYRNINFGESESTVKRKVKSDPEMEFVPPEEDYLGWKGEIVIAETTCDIRFFFNEDQLWKVDIDGPDHHESMFSNAKNYRDILVKIISSKYGEPSKVQKVEFSDIDWSLASAPSWSHVWGVNATSQDKVIKIGYSRMINSAWASLRIEYSSTSENTEEDVESESESF